MPGAIGPVAVPLTEMGPGPPGHGTWQAARASEPWGPLPRLVALGAIAADRESELESLDLRRGLATESSAHCGGC